ncbi:hypothetical protein [Streptomyces sp. NPDC051286]|uniref:hypothetical protein n=1 Tax=Streptomyces sp. NPDC051286 TaxID=3365647 RepID=UPI003797EE97
MPDDGFDIVRAYDSIEDPALRSEFLDAFDVTRPLINSLRRRRDAERGAAAGATPPRDAKRETAEATPQPNASAPTSRDGDAPRRRVRRTPRRPRVIVTTRPPNKDRALRRYRRTPPTVVFIIILKSD